MEELCKTVQRSQWCCTLLVITAEGHVWIAAEKRIPCDWCSVSPKKGRVTRSNTACRVRVFEFNSFIVTVDGVLMIPNLLQKVCSDATQI